MSLECESETAQKHGHIGALSAVVGVELIEDEVGEAGGGVLPQRCVVRAQQQLVEHFVVGQQDVRWVIPHGVPVGDQTVGGDRGAAGGACTDVNAGADGGELRRGGDDLREPLRLVGGQGIDRIQDERFDGGDAEVGRVVLARIGRSKVRVLPEPVPVVTMVGSGRRIRSGSSGSLLVSRRKATA